MNNFLRHIASPDGSYRPYSGTSLIEAGLLRARKNWCLSALGLLPRAMGGADLCPLAPLHGLPFEETKLREILGPVPAA
ncbi:hypothetical protein [Hymenobacter sp. GOD-10R]|jgi:hypothetical protein|uniref:hypothetical protein n=1 Tax=Hymenobacter sp. GOD-10R TaxID=3093922 RepID=UPI002D779148|nr:hypothetical protein [Hymenobacter sp. GOD-10R]WRQ31379.1 hypothetical protein SD425_27205 [Hymenobacter sp. GOD-10R]